MPAQTVTLQLPGSLYNHFKERAKRARGSLEAELLKVVTAAETEPGELPPQLARAVADLRELGDEALWQVARDHLPHKAALELEALNHKQQREGLNSVEEGALNDLAETYDRFLLLRAEAAGLLQDRGHDISVLIDTE